MEQSWWLFKDTFLKAQGLSIPQHKKSSKGSRILEWLSKDLLVRLREKKEKCRHWKKEWVSWEEYRDTVQVCRGRIRKA